MLSKCNLHRYTAEESALARITARKRNESVSITNLGFNNMINKLTNALSLRVKEAPQPIPDALEEEPSSSSLEGKRSVGGGGWGGSFGGGLYKLNPVGPRA